MVIQHRFCANHPQRPAIGVCVMTAKPICGECSTRYEGVNYSSEGLALLHKQRAALQHSGNGSALLSLAFWCAAPVMMYLLYLSFSTTADLLMLMLHPKAG